MKYARYYWAKGVEYQNGAKSIHICNPLGEEFYAPKSQVHFGETDDYKYVDVPMWIVRNNSLPVFDAYFPRFDTLVEY